MKISKYYIFLLIAALSFSSCSSLLDEDPAFSQNSSVVFSSKNNAELALLGCYGYMTYTDGFGQMWQQVPILGSGFAFGQRNGGSPDRLTSLDVLATEELVSMGWNGMFKVVSEVNAFLESLDNSDLSEADKLQMAGEAKFLRAVAYYNLTSLFGDVPLKTAASSSDGIAVPRSPQADVFAQVIADLKEATQIDSEIVDGRANSWAAKAFLGKVYNKMANLGIDTQANLTNAKNMFDEVYNANIFSLEPKFGKLFGDYVTGSKEAIFQLNFSTVSTICYNRGSNLFAPPLSTTGIAWGASRASKALYDLHEGTYPGDPRIAETFIRSWRTRAGNNQPNPRPMVGDEPLPNDSSYMYPYFTYTVPGDFVIKNGEPTNVLKRHVAKLPYDDFPNRMNPSVSVITDYVKNNGANPKNRAIANSLNNVFARAGGNLAWPSFNKLYDQNQEGTRSHKNLMIYRYAEMLLLMADVYNELGDSQKAIALANEVLTRARNSGATATTQPANWTSGLSQEEVREKLFFERIIELAGEPSMYEMPRIKGEKYFKMALNLHNNHEITKLSAEKYEANTNPWLDRIFNGASGLTDDFVKKNMLLPIPDSEITANSDISNADNNFGY